MKHVLLCVLAGALSAFALPASAAEIACASDGSFNRCPLPGADKMKVKLAQKLEGTCKKDYGWGADSEGVWVDGGCSAVFTYSAGKAPVKKTQKSGDAQCPSGMAGNDCEYFRDGFRAGKEDKAAGVSNAYERHADSYDSRFESSYSRGYDAGWHQ